MVCIKIFDMIYSYIHNRLHLQPFSLYFIDNHNIVIYWWFILKTLQYILYVSCGLSCKIVPTKHTYLQPKPDARCVGPAGPNSTCFLPTQVVDINHCWLAVNKDDLPTSEGVLEIIAYNQALLTASTTFQVNGIYTVQQLGKMDYMNYSIFLFYVFIMCLLVISCL